MLSAQPVNRATETQLKFWVETIYFVCIQCFHTKNKNRTKSKRFWPALFNLKLIHIAILQFILQARLMTYTSKIEIIEFFIQNPHFIESTSMEWGR